jgi:hypothetical protein
VTGRDEIAELGVVAAPAHNPASIPAAISQRILVTASLAGPAECRNARFAIAGAVSGRYRICLDAAVGFGRLRRDAPALDDRRRPSLESR